MRRLRTASWHLLHHLLSQHQHRPLPQLQHRQSKQYPWQLRFLRLKATRPTSWRTLRAPPRHSYLLERVLLQLPQSLKLHQVGMKALITRQYSLPSPPHHHHAKKPNLINQFKRVVVRVSTSTNSGCKPSPRGQRNLGALHGRGPPLYHNKSCGELQQKTSG